ncbi:MAG: ribosome maturation factor RimP [Chitinivibrionales bacterium]|nr:ribosome maturation factor RimP [Chitinivibrionales bacterium]
MNIRDQIIQTVENRLTKLGFELFELKVIPTGPRKIVRVYIDSPTGVTIENCENVSRDLSMLLDVENIFGRQPYILEVSSPGADRPLQTEKDYQRNTGRPVKLKLKEQFEKSKTLTGKILGSSGSGVRLLVKEREVEIPFSQIEHAKIEFEFK